MENALVGIGGVLVLVLLFGGLHRLEAGRRRRMLQDVMRPAVTPVKTFDLQGDLLPREETSLGPVDYRRLPPAEPMAYSVENRQPRHVHNLETGFLVPLATAGGTALCATVAIGALALAYGWPARTVLIVFGVSLAAAWAWRIRVADRVVWQIETWARRDLDNDHNIGRPATSYALVDAGVARQTAGRSVQATEAATRAAELSAFYKACALKGTSEGKLGISPAPVARAEYCKLRDELIKLGIAAWRDPGRPRIGWDLRLGPEQALPIIQKHVITV